MEELRLKPLDLTSEEDGKTGKQAELAFNINHTMPLTREHDSLVKELHKDKIGKNNRVMPHLTCICADVVSIGNNVVGQAMKFLKIIVFGIISIAAVSGVAQTRNDSIRLALSYQLQHYPASQYRDVYKNFMQDYFGPGHILNDTVAAGKYLRYELENSEKFDGPDFEPTGFEGNFYRVNLRLIKEGTIAYDDFFEAFVESVQDILPPDGETWMNIWSEIDNEISIIGATFVNEEQDRAELAEQFSQGNFIVHHSHTFNEANNFHYRIISKDIFNRRILHYIKGN